MNKSISTVAKNLREELKQIIYQKSHNQKLSYPLIFLIVISAISYGGVFEFLIGPYVPNANLVFWLLPAALFAITWFLANKSKAESQL